MSIRIRYSKQNRLYPIDTHDDDFSTLFYQRLAIYYIMHTNNALTRPRVLYYFLYTCIYINIFYIIKTMYLQ